MRLIKWHNSHHLILPGAPCTPQCNIYTVSHLSIPESKQAELAALFNAYLASSAATDGLEYLAVAASREDPKVVVCLAGFKDEATAQRVSTVSSSHDQIRQFGLRSF